jgi:hypothetical protein
MSYPLLTSKDISTSYFKNNEFGFSLPLIVTTIEGETFVMAKSVVRWVIESNYKYGKDPFIDSIEKLCAADIMYFEIKDKEILLKVWDKSGNFPAIIFVKIITLLSRLKEVFNELSDDTINDISKHLKCMVENGSN